MSVARPVYPGASMMVTRRVRLRTFLLRPGKRTNEIVGYVLATMSEKWGVRVIAVDVMSNHWHVVVSDPDGKIVDFKRDCHSFISRAVNAVHGEFEGIWSSSQPSRVECEEPADVIDRIAYTMANPVEAGLVMHGSSWPGLRMAWPSKPKTFKRPMKFFVGEEKGGRWPKEAVLELHRPPGYDELSDEDLAAVVNGAIHDREDLFRAKHKREGQAFLGRRQVLRQSRHTRPSSKEPRFGISPKVACKDKWRRIERLRADKEWLRSYGAARKRYLAGERDVEFPYGTYQMVVQWGARCARPPD